MKINKFVTFLIALISGCTFVDGTVYNPIYLANGYFDNTVKAYIYQNYLSYDDYKTIEQKWDQIIFDLGTSVPARLELSSSGKWMAPVLALMIKKDDCVIQTYTNAELLELKLKAGYSTENNNVVFIVGKKGISVVSRTEYEKLRSTFKPHPYDASLCKPAPKE